MVKISEVIDLLNNWAHPSLQETYDNAGVICGNVLQNVTGVLISLDCLESTVEEAIKLKANLIIAHHPIVFSGIKSITGKNYVERTLIKAIQNNIVIFAIHTNLDNVLNGVNYKIAKLLHLKDVAVLKPMKGKLLKFYTYVPKAHLENVKNAIFKAGAGNIGNYRDCSFSVDGIGTFKPNTHAKPFVGEVNKAQFEAEVKLEVILPFYKKNEVLKALKQAHPYEEVAYEFIVTENYAQNFGSGMVGNLEKPISENDFFDLLKKTFKLKVIKHTALLNKKILRVAVCGGAGSFLLNNAKAANAQIFITSDFKYHEYFDAENNIIIADIGHYESEQFTIDLIGDFLNRNFSTFAVHLSKVNTNPVHYYF